MKAKRVLNPETRVEGGCLVGVKRGEEGGGGCFVPVEEYIIQLPQSLPYVSEQKVSWSLMIEGSRDVFKEAKMKKKEIVLSRWNKT